LVLPPPDDAALDAPRRERLLVSDGEPVLVDRIPLVRPDPRDALALLEAQLDLRRRPSARRGASGIGIDESAARWRRVSKRWIGQ
jgi:hypothetical protein